MQPRDRITPLLRSILPDACATAHHSMGPKGMLGVARASIEEHSSNVGIFV